jgi:hypothetical protein
MSVIATQTQLYSNVVKREEGVSWGQCKKVVTVNDVAQTLQIGAVLGQVTATGSYKLCDVTAVDGSQVAVAVVVGDKMGHPMPTVLPAATDTKVLVLYRGPSAVSDKALSYAASIDTTAEKNAMYAQLAAVGIDVLTTI